MTEPNAIPLSQLEAGPPPGTLLCHLSELPEHGGKELLFTDGASRLSLIVQRHQGQIVVFENSCPHAGTPLNLVGDRFMNLSEEQLICRTHGALFCPESGLCTAGPCKGQYLRKVQTKIQGGGLYSL